MMATESKESKLKFAATLAAILMVAVAARALFWAEAGDLTLFQEPTGDAATFVQMAQDFEENGLSAPQGTPYLRAPLYPLFLRGLAALGLGLEGARVVQFFLGVMGTGFLWILGGRMAGRTGSVVAALGGALYGPFVFFEAEMLSIVLAVFFLELALVLWGRSSWAPVAGLCLGMAALSQPNFLIAGVLAAGFSIVRPRTLGWNERKTAVFLALGLLIPPAATFTRNLAVSGQPVIISVNGGVNFFIGNNPAADGTFSLPPDSGLLNRPEGLFTSAREVAETDRARSLSPVEVDRYWWLQGADFWIGQPGRAMSLTLAKVMKALNATELPSHYDYGYIQEKVKVLRFLPTMGWLLPLGALGLILSRRNRKFPGIWFFLFFLASVVPFFITGRYRLPLAVFLWPAAGVAVKGLWESRRNRAQLGGMAAVVAAYALFANIPLYEAGTTRAHMLNVEGMALMQQGDLTSAKSAFEGAVEANPFHAQALNNLAFLLQQEGNIREALLTYRRALLADPLQAETYMNLEELYRKAGRPRDALRILDEFEKARAGQVEDQAAQLALRRGMNTLALGDSADVSAALNAAARAAALAPRDHEALVAYGRALEAAGNSDRAIEMYIRAVRSGHKDLELFYHVGALLLDAGRGEEAEGFLLAANEGRPHPAALWALGQYYERTGRGEDAATAYDALVRIQAPQADEARTRLEAIRGQGPDGSR